MEVASLTATVFYLFSPALVFVALSGTELSWDLGARIVGVAVGVWTMMIVLALSWTRIRGHDPAKRAAVMLAMASPNVGNMGIPVALLAFGDRGLEIAVVNFVIGAVMTNSAGIAIDSTADGGSWRQMLSAPCRYPYAHAAAVGLLVNAGDVELPVAVDSSVHTLAGAAIPVMLVVLGLQLRNPASRTELLDLGAVTAVRLLMAPSLAFAGATLVGLDGVERATVTVLAAMPVAVITTIVATEFRTRPDFVTRTVIVTTLASIATLTGLITVLD